MNAGDAIIKIFQLNMFPLAPQFCQFIPGKPIFSRHQRVFAMDFSGRRAQPSWLLGVVSQLVVHFSGLFFLHTPSAVQENSFLGFWCLYTLKMWHSVCILNRDWCAIFSDLFLWHWRSFALVCHLKLAHIWYLRNEKWLIQEIQYYKYMIRDKWSPANIFPNFTNWISWTPAIGACFRKYTVRQ